MEEQNQQNNKPSCGRCQLVINELEPLSCGLCEQYFHATNPCASFSSNSNKVLCVQGKAVFVCIACRAKLKGKSLREFFASKQNDCDDAPPPQTVPDALMKQIQLLTATVASLSEQVARIMANQQQCWPSLAPEGSVCQDPAPSVDRRTEVRWRPTITARSAPKGTKSIDLSGLSVSTIAAKQAPPKFWLYLAGFDPRITDADMEIIVSRCLDLDESPAEITRLVAKGADVNKLTYVSFKVGLDPDLKQQALEDVWPAGISYREFITEPKNSQPTRQRGGGIDVSN